MNTQILSRGSFSQKKVSLSHLQQTLHPPTCWKWKASSSSMRRAEWWWSPGCFCGLHPVGWDGRSLDGWLSASCWTDWGTSQGPWGRKRSTRSRSLKNGDFLCWGDGSNHYESLKAFKMKNILNKSINDSSRIVGLCRCQTQEAEIARRVDDWRIAAGCKLCTHDPPRQRSNYRQSAVWLTTS